MKCQNYDVFIEYVNGLLLLCVRAFNAHQLNVFILMFIDLNFWTASQNDGKNSVIEYFCSFLFFLSHFKVFFFEKKSVWLGLLRFIFNRIIYLLKVEKCWKLFSQRSTSFRTVSQEMLLFSCFINLLIFYQVKMSSFLELIYLHQKEKQVKMSVKCVKFPKFETEIN